jgi:hypothetical protein
MRDHVDCGLPYLLDFFDLILQGSIQQFWLVEKSLHVLHLLGMFSFPKEFEVLPSRGLQHLATMRRVVLRFGAGVVRPDAWVVWTKWTVLRVANIHGVLGWRLVFVLFILTEQLELGHLFNFLLARGATAVGVLLTALASLYDLHDRLLALPVDLFLMLDGPELGTIIDVAPREVLVLQYLLVLIDLPRHLGVHYNIWR